MLQSPSRSNSALTFSPGAHRRSYPNLQHLSLAPLTPKYPITPSDYSAYFDPETSQLHTSSSLSHIASLPSPVGILSQSSSRATSRNRQRKSKSSFSIQMTSGTPRGALSSEGFGGKMIHPSDSMSSPRPVGGHPGLKKNESSWLLQTGMALTEGSRESKGQSWLAKRASSTSLQSPAIEDYLKPEHAQAPSGRVTPVRSRRGSRDRRKGRRELAMTPAATNSISVDEKATTQKSHASQGTSLSVSNNDQGTVEPDWADSQTQAEIAADLEMEFAAELEDGELYSDDGDRYSALDFEDQGIEDEETEIQQALRARGFGIGRWVDGVVDVFLQLDDAEEDEPRVQHENSDQSNITMAKDEKKARDPIEGLGISDRDDVASDDEMEPAPQHPKTVWEDLAWFARLVLRTAKS